jgi:amino acid transporter
VLRQRTEGGPAADAAQRAIAPARSGFGLVDAVVLGLSGSGPAQTLAVSLAGLVAACHHGGALPVLLCFVPMLGIALGYQRLNRWDPNAGATYTWVARTFHPYLGFLAGWMILLYYTLGTSSLTIPAGTYTLELLAPRFVDRPLAVALAGGGWNIVVTLLALKGLKVAARFEAAIVLFQYAVLLTVAVAGLFAIAHGTASAPFSWHWFSAEGVGGMRGLMGGILIACFMYSGWDAAIYINEEAADRANAPGQAAIASVVILALCYVICVLGYQGSLPPGVLQAHAGNALAVVGPALLGKPWGTLMSLAVLTGTLATLQAAIISAARVGFAMARDRVMPGIFRRVEAGSGNPWAATAVMSLLNLALLALALGTSDIGVALANIVSSLGLIAIVFYGLTGATAVWQGRAHLHRSARDLLLGGLLPGAGAAFMAWVAIQAVRSGATTPAVLAYGAGSIALGAVVALLLHLIARVPFFTRSAPPSSHLEGKRP